METNLLVFFDISDDKIRRRISEVCKDYGLNRIQYSVFWGTLTKNKREEFCFKISEEIKVKNAKILIQPICEKCFECAFVIGEFKKQKLPEIDETDDIPIDNPKIWNVPLKNLPKTED
ncbi:MAG: CRISPR-associated endonuclease Cas2 [Elusimicrobia bacterium]|nr:CRISPR-associated endonuclease Cas2 [Elusimicrobiota bacterium]